MSLRALHRLLPVLLAAGTLTIVPASANAASGTCTDLRTRSVMINRTVLTTVQGGDTINGNLGAILVVSYCVSPSSAKAVTTTSVHLTDRNPFIAMNALAVVLVNSKTSPPINGINIFCDSRTPNGYHGPTPLANYFWISGGHNINRYVAAGGVVDNSANWTTAEQGSGFGSSTYAVVVTQIGNFDCAAWQLFT